MSGLNDTIDTAAIRQYSQNVIMLAQQRSSRLRRYMEDESVRGESLSIERLGPTEMVERNVRNEWVVGQDQPHSRRRLVTRPYAWHTWVDDFDKLRMMEDPTSRYSMMAEMAYGRRQDKSCIEGALGAAYEGKDGLTKASFPDSQKIACPTSDTSTTHSRLSVEGLLQIRQLFWENEATMTEDQNIIFVTRAKDLAALLRDQKVTSSDYNTVQALAAGTVNSYLGFTFVRTELLPQTTAPFTKNGTTAPIGSFINFAFVPGCVHFGITKESYVTVDRIPLRSNSHLLQMHAINGTARDEDVKVAQLITKE